MTLFCLCQQSTDGGMISKAKVPTPSSSNQTTPTTSQPTTKNTSNKNDELNLKENNKMIKKTGPSTSNIHDPKKKLMVEEAKGKVYRLHDCTFTDDLYIILGSPFKCLV